MRIGNPLRGLVAERAGFRCEYCHYPEEFSPSSGGLTSIGRGTVEALRMNNVQPFGSKAESDSVGGVVRR